MSAPFSHRLCSAQLICNLLQRIRKLLQPQFQISLRCQRLCLLPQTKCLFSQFPFLSKAQSSVKSRFPNLLCQSGQIKSVLVNPPFSLLPQFNPNLSTNSCPSSLGTSPKHHSLPPCSMVCQTNPSTTRRFSNQAPCSVKPLVSKTSSNSPSVSHQSSALVLWVKQSVTNRYHNLPFLSRKSTLILLCQVSFSTPKCPLTASKHCHNHQ